MCVIALCGVSDLAFGGLQVSVRYEGRPTPVGSATVWISQMKDRILTVIDKGKTQESGEPYKPKKTLPKGNLIVSAQKNGKRGFRNDVVYDGGHRSITVELNDRWGNIPLNLDAGRYWVLQQCIRCVAETQVRCCVDADGSSHSTSYTVYRGVPEYVWVPLHFDLNCGENWHLGTCDEDGSRGCDQSSCDDDAKSRPVPDSGCLYEVGEAKLIVSVPSDATVVINGRATKITGSRRVYISKGLIYGYSYRYVVHARIARDGKTFEDTRTVILRPGDSTEITFDFSGNRN